MPSNIPDYSLPKSNRQVLLTTRPDGVPQECHFTVSTAAIPRLGANEILIRNIYLSVDPAQRGWASSEANYSAPVPLGESMRALAVGVVIESRNSDFAKGEFLYGFFGWQDYACVGNDKVIHRATQDLPLDAFVGLCGINGITAYLALTDLGRPKKGDTLVVSTAAGSVGSFVGQIGRSLGCRTIGFTGSDEKVERCLKTFGYDEAYNYKTVDLDAVLDAVAPEGVNVYYDSTGGTILDTVLRRMAIGGRIVQCGTASIGSWNPQPTGPRNEREILTRRLVWSGFVIFDHLDRYAAAANTLTKLYHDGLLTYDMDIAEGIEQAPAAISELYAGKNQGKKAIYIG